MAVSSPPEDGWINLATFADATVKLQRPFTWRPGCGNGVIEPGERFDDGQPFSERPNEYRASCGASCGDAQIQSGEACDDGNNVDDDACDNTCQAP